jgi:hypothetical protein
MFYTVNAYTPISKIGFGGPNTTGSSSRKDIESVAKQEGLDPQQTQQLREAVAEGKQDPGHHLSRKEVEELARDIKA